MNQQNAPIYEEEIDLYDYWKVIVKRKKFIIGLFAVSVISAGVISFLMPKIYRGEIILRLVATEQMSATREQLPTQIPTPTAKEIVSVIGKINQEKMEFILPETHKSMTKIELNDLKDTTDKLTVTIEAKNTKDISDTVSEFVQYINNHPLVKKPVEQQKERLKKQLEEVSKAIFSSKAFPKAYEMLLKEGKLIPVGFNPVDFNRKLVDLEMEKIVLEQNIKNLTGIEVVGQPYISKKPVKPRIKMNIFLAGTVSLFAGVFIVFFTESIEKIKNR